MLWKSFSFDPQAESGVYTSVMNRFTDLKESALRDNRNFAYETNYHSQNTLDTLRLFKTSGFNLELNFIFLANPEMAVERVKKRVAEGGHAVDEATIEYRFYEGLKILDETFRYFDSVSLFNSRENFNEEMMYLEPFLNRIVSINPIPETLAQQLEKLKSFTQRSG